MDTKGLANKGLARFKALSILPLGALVQGISYPTVCNVRAYQPCNLDYRLSISVFSSVKCREQ